MAGIPRLLPVLLLFAGGSSLIPAAPATATPALRAAAESPAAPAGLTATTGNSSVSLAWHQPASGPRPDHFRVYEGDTVVARNTTTHATVTGLGFFTTHTFRVTAVAADGTESPPSGSIRLTVYIPGTPPHCPPTPPVQLKVLDLTSSAVTLGWLQTDPPAEYRITVAGRTITTRGTQIRVGGLAPNETHTVSAVNFGCLGFSNRGSIEVRTPDGPTQWPNQPTDVAVTARTDSSATVSWSAPVGGTQVAYYAIYRGTTRVATTTERSMHFAGLWRGESFPLAVAAIGHDGAESQHSPEISVSAAACDDRPPAPEAVTATAVSASSVELRWLSRTEATSYTVLEGDRVVATPQVPSARITGLSSATKYRFRVVTNLPGLCGTTPPSDRVKAKTLAGPRSRPGTPTGVQSEGTAMTPYGDVAIRWTAPADAGELTYRIYEGATLIGSATKTSFATRVLPATGHQFIVVAVDAAGNESAPSAPVWVWGSHLPLP